MRREKTLTTAGATFFTIGAKERWMTSRLVGGTRVCAAAGRVSKSARTAKSRRFNMPANLGTGPAGRQPSPLGREPALEAFGLGGFLDAQQMAEHVLALAFGIGQGQ